MIWCGLDQRPSSCPLIDPGRDPDCSHFNYHQIGEAAMTKERQTWLTGSTAPGRQPDLSCSSTSPGTQAQTALGVSQASSSVSVGP